ncbi:MAG: FAD binding domain-containing protein, partial [Spirochaetota bacterium]
GFDGRGGHGRRERGGRFVELPPIVALIDGLAELRTVNLTERFIDIGAALTLTEMLELKEGTFPMALTETLRGIATPSIRNLATIGGNLATRRRFMDAWAVLACLEALVELRDGAGSRWMNINRLIDAGANPSFPAGSLMTRVRMPIDTWTVSVVRKTGNKHWPALNSGIFVLLAKIDKGIVASFRMVWAGEKALRFPELEKRLLGKRLPLERRERSSLRDEYLEAASVVAPELAKGFCVLVEAALDHISR